MAKNIIALKEFYKTCEIKDNVLNTITLFKKDKKGDVRFISFHIIITDDIIDAEDNDGHWIQKINKKNIDFETAGIALYYSASGKEGCKITISKPTYIKAGKNIGRINETTPFQQALSDVKSKYTKRIDLGDAPVIEEIKFENHKRINIMKLENAKKHLNKIKYPCYMQEKLDGIHAVAVMFDDVDIYSRGKKKEFNLQHIRKDIKEFYNGSFKSKLLKEGNEFLKEKEEKEKNYYGMFISGELYCEGEIRQDITSMVMSGNDDKIKLYVFDAFWVPNEKNKNEKLPYKARYEILQQFIKDINSKYIILIPTFIATSIKDIEKYYEEIKKKDGEGVIVRNFDGLYEYGKRSFGVMKYKIREDAEFKIVDYEICENGKYKGLIIFVAETNKGLRFNVEPNWKPEDRIKAIEEFDAKYKNKMATISYDNISSLGIPQQAKLIAFV